MERLPTINGRRRQNDRGAALLIVLLLLSTLSVIALLMTATMRLTTARTISGEAANQASWYAGGAETFSTMLMAAQWQAEPARDTLRDRWVQDEVSFPLDDGMITARLRDETVCFNINSVVSGTAEGRTANQGGIAEYNLLLSALGFSSSARASLTDSLVDWLDTDSRVRPDGAEDREYGSLDVPYRAANTLIADISELRAVYWYSAKVYRRLKPYICAHPTSAPAAININLVTEAQVPVLYAMLGGAVSETATQSLIDVRPQDGFQSLDQFWNADAGLVAEPPDDVLRARPRLWSEFVRLEATVNHAGASLSMTSLLEVSNDGAVSVKARKIGLTE